MNTIILRNSQEDLTWSVRSPTPLGPTGTSAKISISGITIEPYRPRLGITERYGKDGGQVTGDQQVGARKLTMGVDLTASNDSDYFDAMSYLSAHFIKSLSPFYVIDDANSRRCLVAYGGDNLKLTDKGTEYRVYGGDLDFRMLDGVWEDSDATQTTTPTGGITNNGTLTVSNSGKFLTYPIITVTAIDSVTSFTLRNTSNDVFMTFSSNDFNPGDVFTINARTGRIQLESGGSTVESSVSLSDGSSMIYLSPGDNVIRYESSSGDVELDIQHRERYPY